ncbi:MAG TPA: hypothetical protein VGK74_02715 [Symbiobacteriaceae bacterium]|jgi:hypothetical protein
MAGTVTIAEETYSTMKKIAFAWTSTAGGIATATTDGAYSGEIRRLVTVPGTAGAQPTDQYDVTVNDQDGTDVLMGAGANRSNAATEQVLASSLGVVANDTLALSITNAGNAKSGTVYLYLR